MANEQNLNPVRTEGEARELGRKGGVASGESRRAKRDQRIRLKQLLELEIDKDTLTDKQNDMLPQGLKNIDGTLDNKTLIDISLMKAAGKGDVAAVKYINELVETDNRTESTWYGLPACVVGKDFIDVYRDIQARNHRHYDFEGGRGSLKSTFCGEIIIDDIMTNPTHCAIALRQVKDRLADSVYAQTVWAIEELGLSKQFKCTKNPLRITRKETGQIIYFEGADDPGKIKSIKPPNGMHIGVIWFEEKDQFRGEAAIRNILQSLMRGGDEVLVISAYNTPRSAHHFINRAKIKPKKNRLIHQSCYLNAPPEWLGKAFFEEAEDLKATNELAYRHEYLGEAVGVGDTVFENVTTRAITNEEIKRFDTCYYGQDWGWFPDPNHFAGCYYHAGSRKLYIYEEIRANKCSNEEWAKKIEHHKHDRITADSAEQKSINDHRAWEFDMRGAIKGPGSVEYGIKWLQSLTEIIIDPVRCPKTAEEFTLYEYDKDKDGNVISGYPDRDNHSIDAVRYALEQVWKRRGQ